MTGPGVTVAPGPAPAHVRAAIAAGGGRLADPEQAAGLVWLGDGPAGLRDFLETAPAIGWVQLPAAGVEDYLPLMTDGRTWTCARGVTSAAVAEHALMLAMIGVRDAAASVRSGTWAPRPAAALAGRRFLVVGGGGITTTLISLLRPFGAPVTVVRRGPGEVPGAAATWPADMLDQLLPDAGVVVLAAPLTPSTAGLIDARRLRAMRRDACLVNVARGGLVGTGDLVTALREGWIAAAGLDVTDPEPLPAGHPLWTMPNCFITAHCAGDLAGSVGAFAGLVARNVRAWVSGAPLSGLVDSGRGY
jgi:phosphoglycerate dehydrogenase-like enzyme